MYLLSFSPEAQDALLEMLERGALQIHPIERSDIPRIRALIQKYRDLPMDLADASLVRVAGAGRNPPDLHIRPTGFLDVSGRPARLDDQSLTQAAPHRGKGLHPRLPSRRSPAEGTGTVPHPSPRFFGRAQRRCVRRNGQGAARAHCHRPGGNCAAIRRLAASLGGAGRPIPAGPRPRSGRDRLTLTQRAAQYRETGVGLRRGAPGAWPRREWSMSRR